VLLWRLIGVTHLLLANITQNLQARPCLLASLSGTLSATTVAMLRLRDETRVGLQSYLTAPATG